MGQGSSSVRLRRIQLVQLLHLVARTAALRNQCHIHMHVTPETTNCNACLLTTTEQGSFGFHAKVMIITSRVTR